MCLIDKLDYLLLILHTLLFLARFPVELWTVARLNVYLEEPGIGGSVVIS